MDMLLDTRNELRGVFLSPRAYTPKMLSWQLGEPWLFLALFFNFGHTTFQTGLVLTIRDGLPVQGISRENVLREKFTSYFH
jgi:hypothetical protein